MVIGVYRSKTDGCGVRDYVGNTEIRKDAASAYVLCPRRKNQGVFNLRDVSRTSTEQETGYGGDLNSITNCHTTTVTRVYIRMPRT